MPDFTYQALTETHEMKTGRITAASAAEAVALLESQGLAVHMIRQIESSDEISAESSGSSRTQEGENKILRDRINQMLKSRDTLAPALAAFAEEMPTGRPRRQLKRLVARLSAGAAADELCQSPEMTAALLPLLGGGASLGSTSFLHDLFAEASRDNAVRTQRARVLAYPLVVVALAMIVLILLCLMVVPTFSNIYDDFAMELPEMSKWVVGFSNEMLHHPGRLLTLLLICPAVGYAVLRLLIATGLPGFLLGDFARGSSRQVSAMASFVRRLADSLRGGFSLPVALRLAGRASGRGWLNREAMSLAEKIESPDDRPWCSRLPPTLLYALRAGTGGTPNLRLLQELAELYAERVHARFDWSSGFVPQFAILFVGIVVGFVLLGLFLPLVQLINGLSG